VKRLRDSGLSLQRIQKGLDVLRKRWPKEDPLLDEVIVTDGVTLFRRVAKDQIEDLLGDGQLVFNVVAVGRVRDELQEKILRLNVGEIPARGRRNRNASGA
jgi:hypothetical protein